MVSIAVRHSLSLLLLGAAAGCVEGYREEGTELWSNACVEAPCGWEQLAGSLGHSSTWSASDYAFTFEAPGTKITRRVGGYGCQRLELLGEVEASAELSLQLDFNEDDIVDFSTLVPPTRWAKTTFLVNGPADQLGMRITLEKRGVGTAAIARLRTNYDPTCTEAPASLRPTTFTDGSLCRRDAECASGRCRSGLCTSCGASGCGEGERCREDAECSDGACAAGVCRACAKQGTCAFEQPCSGAGQCASQSCIAGAQPRLTGSPHYDAVCGECASDAACDTGKCVEGRCAACRDHVECGVGFECRYADLYEARTRACVPTRGPHQLPRGALCELETDCADGLACGAATGRAKRCGVACAADGDCAPNALCAAEGAVGRMFDGGWVRMSPAWSEPIRRVATCHADNVGGRCAVHAQCDYGGCCGGACSWAFDPRTGACTDDSPFGYP